ncbi:chord-domain-containing protein [Dentipellis sp. KUC8613]|nr:chord-domain-containing protein [Dentipellis sp. KUC8613]
MARCSNKGCGQEFDPASNTNETCVYHPGAPIFHEGLKSWSCCNTVNKPVLEFDEFMKIPGCMRGNHSAEPPKAEKTEQPAAQNNTVKLTETDGQKESYTSVPAVAQPVQSTPAVASARPAAPAPPVEEEEDLDAQVPSGTKCRHHACEVRFASDAEHRRGDGPGTVCTYHPGQPIFHEGSKGYMCCKRRVLEFDEFLKIEGCKQGRHVFVPKSKKEQTGEELASCRIDHYQTPNAVHVTVFAKQADKERSSIAFEENQIHLDILLPGPKRFRRSLKLFGPIDAATSTYKYYGTKVELTLKKSDARSWTLLEKTDRDLGNISLTFGVTGRTGTIGAKELILDDQNSQRQAA